MLAQRVLAYHMPAHSVLTDITRSGGRIQSVGEHIKDAVSEQIIAITRELASQEGAHKVTVRKILAKLGMTNRVFYNRFSNADEVLQIVYARAVEETRECVRPHYTDKESFIAFCLDTAVEVLMLTYEVKVQFSGYMFEHNSLTEENRLWWADGIKKHYQYALDHGFAKKVDADAGRHLQCLSGKRRNVVSAVRQKRF